LLDALRKLGQARALQEYLVFAATEHAREQRLLEGQHRQHAFLDTVLADEVELSTVQALLLSMPTRMLQNTVYLNSIYACRI
jgi:hypothetical protein